MITIVDPEQRYEAKIGDVFWGAASDWAAPDNGEEPEPRRVCGLQLNVVDGKEQDLLVIPLNAICPHPFKSLRHLGIDAQWFEGVKHKDPYTDWEVYGAIPTAVVTSDNQKYEESLKSTRVPFVDVILDSNFWKEQYKKIFEPSEIARLFLGSGYEYGCSIYDGDRQMKPAKLKLSNGDWLYIWFWEWYNK